MFKGLGGLGDLGKLMSQAQEMQQKATEMQESLDRIEVEGSAGAGMAKAVCTAKGRVLRVSLDPSLFTPEDKEVAEDLLVAAVNDAQDKASARAEQEMAKLTEGLPIPPGMFGR